LRPGTTGSNTAALRQLISKHAWAEASDARDEVRDSHTRPAESHQHSDLVAVTSEHRCPMQDSG